VKVCSHDNAEFWHVITFADVAAFASTGVLMKVLGFLLSSGIVDALLWVSLLDILAAAFFVQY
jgi:hypothetical protein